MTEIILFLWWWAFCHFIYSNVEHFVDAFQEPL